MPRRKQTPPEAALAHLHARIHRCDRCPLHRTRTQAVPGTGPAAAKIMLVGEAPGRQEDRRGEPFVGAAGRFLDDLLDSVGLSRQSVYITNVVKSRPVSGAPPRSSTRLPSTRLGSGGAGRNRAPAPQEIAACAPWLDAQLRIIRPRLIVTLGRVALQHFVPGASIAKVHGKAIRGLRATILPLYHPAVALYRRDWIAVLRRDFRQIRRLQERF